jgi:hypothetical protein
MPLALNQRVGTQNILDQSNSLNINVSILVSCKKKSTLNSFKQKNTYTFLSTKEYFVGNKELWRF